MRPGIGWTCCGPTCATRWPAQPPGPPRLRVRRALPGAGRQPRRLGGRGLRRPRIAADDAVPRRRPGGRQRLGRRTADRPRLPGVPSAGLSAGPSAGTTPGACRTGCRPSSPRCRQNGGGRPGRRDHGRHRTQRGLPRRLPGRAPASRRGDRLGLPRVAAAGRGGPARGRRSAGPGGRAPVGRRRQGDRRNDEHRAPAGRHRVLEARSPGLTEHGHGPRGSTSGPSRDDGRRTGPENPDSAAPPEGDGPAPDIAVDAIRQALEDALRANQPEPAAPGAR
ncbi:hypothetical protein QF032_007899 [Streptomyces achromogenes]|nr:hypothetical protein [Streptomyces achromogenes]